MIKNVLSAAILFNVIALQFNVGFAQTIEDDVAAQAFNGQKLVKPVYQKTIIEDEAVLDFKDKNLTRPPYKKVVLEDTIVKNDAKLQNCTKPAVHHYKMIDENAEIVKISVCSARLLQAKDGLQLGQKVDFKVSADVYKGGAVFIKKDTPALATVELISKSARYGDPEEIELGRFSTKDVNDNTVELVGNIRKEGANRGKWAKPLYYAGTVVPFGAPLMAFYFVKGGKTKIRPEQKFELYYE